MVDRQAAAQPTEVGQTIYKAHADALREEGKDREKGMEGGQPSSGPADTSVTGAAGSQQDTRVVPPPSRSADRP